MAKRTKVPLARAHPAVRALVDQLLEWGYTASQVHERLQRLAGDEGERAHLCPGASAADLRSVSLRSIHDRARFLRGRQPREGTDDQAWRWWDEPDPATARHVLAALAQYRERTGYPLQPVTRALVERFSRLLELTPGLDAAACLVLAHWWLLWERLPEREREQRLTVLGQFIGFAPWVSPEAERLYDELTAGSDRIVLDGGVPVYVVGVGVAPARRIRRLAGEQAQESGGASLVTGHQSE